MAPYKRGDQVAHLALDGDTMLVTKGTVESCVRLGEDRWSVVTDVAIEQVDGEGINANLVPLDDELRQEFEQHPDGFTIAETLRDLDQIPEQPEIGQERGESRGY